MSQIRNIYSVIASFSVHANGAVPAVYMLETLPDSLETAQIPVRLLTPADSSEVVAYDSATGKAIWQITDTLFYKPVAQGLGASENAVLVDYLAEYVAEVMSKHVLITAKAVLNKATCESGVYAWPSGSDRIYHGVRCTLQVIEIL